MPNNYQGRGVSSRAQVDVRKIKGLSSLPDVQVPLDRLAKAKNFIFTSNNVLKMRNGSSPKFILPSDQPVSDAIEVDSSVGSFVLLLQGRRMLVWDGTILSVLEYSSNKNIFSTLTTVRRCCSYLGFGYAVDGTEYIYKTDGATITRLTLPETATYGNAVDIFEYRGALFVLTDLGYLRYTQVRSDTVWEARTVLPGNLTTGTTGTTVTGIGTYFTNLTPGSDLIITDGVNTEIRKIATITNNTTLVLTTALSNSYTSGNIILKGVSFFVPVDPGDDLTPIMATRYGNNIAVAKASNNILSPFSKLFSFSPVTVDDTTGSIVFKQQIISDTFTLHPYSLRAYLDSLLFLTDIGVFMVAPSAQDIDTIRPVNISYEKIEDIMQNTIKAKRRNSRISILTLGEINCFFCHITTDTIGDFNTKILMGTYDQQSNEFEYTEVEIPSTNNDSGAEDALEFNHTFSLQYENELFYLGKSVVMSIFEDNNYTDLVPKRAFLPVTCDSTVVTCDTVVVTADNEDSNSFLNILTPIKRYLKTGALSNDLFNTLSIYKYWILVKEINARNILPVDSYNTRFVLDEVFQGFTTQRVYAPGFDNNLVTMDSIIVTMDNDTVTMDSTFVIPTQITPIEWFSKMKNSKTAALEITDEFSSGSLELRGYGFILRPSRFS